LFLLFLDKYDAKRPRELPLAEFLAVGSRDFDADVFFSVPAAAFRSRPTTGTVAFLPDNTAWFAASYAIKVPFGEWSLAMVDIFLAVILLVGFMLPRLAAIESFTFIFSFFGGYLSGTWACTLSLITLILPSWRPSSKSLFSKELPLWSSEC
tara:strand:+ start:97 stop:552 length:456 start_codon:yes stop_codon:yes gene_type:complete